MTTRSINLHLHLHYISVWMSEVPTQKCSKWRNRTSNRVSDVTICLSHLVLEIYVCDRQTDRQTDNADHCHSWPPHCGQSANNWVICTCWKSKDDDARTLKNIFEVEKKWQHKTKTVPANYHVPLGVTRHQSHNTSQKVLQKRIYTITTVTTLLPATVVEES